MAYGLCKYPKPICRASHRAKIGKKSFLVLQTTTQIIGFDNYMCEKTIHAHKISQDEISNTYIIRKKKSVDKYVNNIFHRLDINILNGIIGQLANLICVWK